MTFTRNGRLCSGWVSIQLATEWVKYRATYKFETCQHLIMFDKSRLKVKSISFIEITRFDNLTNYNLSWSNAIKPRKNQGNKRGESSWLQLSSFDVRVNFIGFRYFVRFDWIISSLCYWTKLTSWLHCEQNSCRQVGQCAGDAARTLTTVSQPTRGQKARPASIATSVGRRIIQIKECSSVFI